MVIYPGQQRFALGGRWNKSGARGEKGFEPVEAL